MAEKLTVRRIDGVKPPSTGRIEIMDAVSRGLCYRVTSGGDRTWTLRIKMQGRDRRFTIGEYPAMSLADARRAASKLREGALTGVDPIAERRRRNALPTVAIVLDIYVDQHLVNLKDGKRREGQLRAGLRHLLTRPMAEIKPAELQAAIDAKAMQAPVAANRFKAALVHFSTWSRRREYLELSIGAELEAPTRERSRDRVLSLSEIGAIWRASLTEKPIWGRIVRLLILTAQRRSDVSKMLWAEIEGTRWTTPSARTKNGRPHTVHLTDASLREIGNKIDDSATLLFTTTGDTAVSGFGRLKQRLDKTSGVADWTFHDFRTAFATHCAEAGVPEAVVDRVLNHAATGSAASAVARVYQRSALLPQRAEALEQWAEMVLSA